MNNNDGLLFPTLNLNTQPGTYTVATVNSAPQAVDEIRFPTLNDPPPGNEEFEAVLAAAKIPGQEQGAYATETVRLAGNDPDRRFEAVLQAAKIPGQEQGAYATEAVRLARNDPDR